MSKRFKSEDVRKLIHADVAKSSREAVGEKLGYSRIYISLILSGQRGISKSVAMAYGFDRHEKPAEVWFTKQETY